MPPRCLTGTRVTYIETGTRVLVLITRHDRVCGHDRLAVEMLLFVYMYHLSCVYVKL